MEGGPFDEVPERVFSFREVLKAVVAAQKVGHYGQAAGFTKKPSGA
jgi:hypothetical protein